MQPNPARVNLFEAERAFTETYQANIDQPPAVREARCLETQFSAIFSPIRTGDLFAGRIDRYPQVGFGLEEAPWERRLMKPCNDSNSIRYTGHVTGRRPPGLDRRAVPAGMW